MGKNDRGVFEREPGVWAIRYVDAEGNLRRERIGSKSAAIMLYRKRKEESRQGKKLPELRARVVTFAELAADATSYIKRKYSRPADDLARLEVVKEWFAGRSADSITPDLIRSKLEEGELEKKWSPSTRNHYHNMVSLCYRLGLEKAKVENSPIHRKVKKAKEDNSRRRFLKPAEEEKLRKVLRSNPEWAEHEPEIDLALHTGLRRTDMYVRLVWENVDLISRAATVPYSKNGDPITVPLNAAALGALAIFRARGNGSGRVVRNMAGETLHVNAHWFVPALRAAGITDFHWHDLRHTYASRLRQHGTRLATIADLLGHHQLAMTRRYAHVEVEHLHREVARLVDPPAPIPTDPSTDPEPLRQVARVQ